MKSRRSTIPRARRRGAALLTALIIVALVATLGAGMMWQQWRAVQVESAERSRTQSRWILLGALDFSRLILREDAKSGGVDSFADQWANPLQESRLSTFLAADKQNTDDGPEAFLSGFITDVQSRYNLRNLVDSNGQVSTDDVQILERLFDFIGVAPALANTLAISIQQSVLASSISQSGASSALQGTGLPQLSSNPPLMPETIDQLAWLGVDRYTIDKLKPFVTLLPQSTPINLNTARKEVIAAVIPGLDLAGAERLVQVRQNKPLQDPQDAVAILNLRTPINPNQAGVSSNYFETRGRIRLEDRVIDQRFLVERRLLDIITLQQERSAGLESSAAPTPQR